MEKIKDWFKKKVENIEFKEYFNDFRKVNWGYIWILIILLYAFLNNLNNYIFVTVCKYLTFSFNYSGEYWPYISIFSLILFYKKIKEIIILHLIPTLFTSVWVFTSIIIINYIEKQSPFYFLKINFWNLFELRFIDIILFYSILLFAQFKSYIEPIRTKNKLSLIDDSEQSSEKGDLYLRENFISKLTDHLTNTPTNNSFSVGIIGEWGSGKTNVIKRIKKKLEKDSNNIIIDIIPWQEKGIAKTIENFFDTLKDKFSYQKSSFSRHINNYYKNIIKENYSTDYLNILSNILRIHQSKTNDFEFINNSILKSKKKIFVFIDDIDRLTGPEIIDIFSFIRTTANFNNTFFIVPYDRNYVIRVLEKSQSTHNESEYLKKIFQLEIRLPEFKKSFYANEIRRYLTSDLDSKSTESINKVIDKIVFKSKLRSVSEKINSIENDYFYNNLFESLIENIRELKRFCNSVKMLISNIEFEADLYDLIILELIKNKDIDLYDQIRNKQILEISPPSLEDEIYVLNDKKLTDITDNSELMGVLNELCHCLIIYLRSKYLIRF